MCRTRLLESAIGKNEYYCSSAEFYVGGTAMVRDAGSSKFTILGLLG